MRVPHHVKTITLVAQELGVSEDLIWEISDWMDQYEGFVWVYDTDGKQIATFTDYGIENLETVLTDRDPNWRRQNPPEGNPSERP